MTKLPVTSLTTAVLALVFVVLSIRVVRGRLSSKTSLGVGGTGTIATGKDAEASPLLVAARAHGNFTEYVPLSLMLIALIELQGGSRAILVGLAAALIVARIAHPVGLGRPSPNAPRAVGFMLNIAVLVVGAIYLALLSL